MKRRDFLRTTALAAVGIGVFGCMTETSCATTSAALLNGLPCEKPYDFHPAAKLYK